MRVRGWLALLACATAVVAQDEVENEESRKVLGSSVVTSVSVIMDHGNGTKTYLTDADGHPLDQGDGSVGSPIDLLNPDRYEFYTFDETGDLVKRLMTLDQIKGLLATGDGETLDGPPSSPNFYHDSLSSSQLDDSDLEPNMAQGVHNVVASVQNVLKGELEASKIKGASGRPPLTIPDSISSWSMLFPAIISDAEALDDGTNSGNSVNDPIEAGDRLPASSNEDKTEIRISQEQNTSQIQESNMATEKPTAVPPIIHFLEIHSVPSPAKDPTKVPDSVTGTTSIVTAATAKPSTTTDNPTSPVSLVQEMSSSLSSLLYQVTDDQTMGDDLKSDNKNKISTNAIPLPTTESVINFTNITDTKSSDKTPQSSNIEEITKSPLESESESSTILINKATTQNLVTISTTADGNVKTTTVKKADKYSEPLENTKKTTDKVVSFVTTSKPTGTIIIKAKPTASSPTATKQKIQSTTIASPTVKNSATKEQTTTQKNPTKPLNVSNIGNNIETLEAHSSQDILKIIPNKQSTTVQTNNKIKNNNQTKTTTPSSKPILKPHKKVPTKPSVNEESSDCNNPKITSQRPSDLNVSEKLVVAASTNSNDKVKPSKIKTPELQEMKIVQKPTTASSTKPIQNKIKPSEDVKITTYKPSTSQPFTTKQSVNKISTTTQQPLNEIKISATKIHEVNSSLLDIKDQVINVTTNKTQIQLANNIESQTSVQNNISTSKLEGAALNTDESTTVVNKNNGLQSLQVTKSSTTDIIDHSAEVECSHSKTPIQSPIQDKISDITHEHAANNVDEIKLTTEPIVPATIITTNSLPDITTEIAVESSTKVLSQDLTTTTELPRETATDLPETTTLNMPDVDFVKEGISAVTNILLDLSPPMEPQLPLPTIPLSESASNMILSPPVKGEVKHAVASADLEMTTTDITEENITGELPSSTSEKELSVYFTTTELPATETLPPTTEDIMTGDTKNVSSESNEDKTEKIINIDTTTSTEELTTTEETDKKQSSASKIVSTTVNRQTLPTKESKLGPENVDETSNSSVECNQTLAQTTSSDTQEDSKNTSDIAENLESAQSIMIEINKINAVTKSPLSTTTVQTTPKTAVKNETPNSDYKTAGKPDSIKFTQVKYPTVPSAHKQHPEATANPPAVELLPAPHESLGLEATTAFLADDVRRFSDLCNELAFRMWTSITGKGSISSRSLVLSPFATTSLLAMVFLGARGPTSGQMNDVLRLDDMVTFNPHQVLQNVTESVLNSRNYGVTTASFVRELYSDKLKGKILDFYKERAQQYYDGHVEEISFNLIGDILRRRTNLLVKRQTLGKVPEYLRGGNLSLRPPLAAFSANIFQTDCDLASTEGRDGEMYFVVQPSTRQRRLVPVPAAVWRTGFLAGYEPGLDATAVALGTDSVVSTILVLPGQQGQILSGKSYVPLRIYRENKPQVAPGDGLARLEQRLIETSYRRGGWTRLLRSLLPRPGLELQVPRFSHRSVLNITSTLQRMGLKDLFNENKADLRGLNGLSNDLHLSDMVQVNTFSTCGEETIGARHHIETYPISPQRMGRDDPDFYPRPEDLEDPELLKIPLNLRPRQARLPDSPRLRFDRPFLYMVRHNPTGMILHMGRFNPRLLP